MIAIIIVASKFEIVKPVVEFLCKTFAEVNKFLNVFEPVLVIGRLYYAVYVKKQVENEILKFKL